MRPHACEGSAGVLLTFPANTLPVAVISALAPLTATDSDDSIVRDEWAPPAKLSVDCLIVPSPPQSLITAVLAFLPISTSEAP